MKDANDPELLIGNEIVDFHVIEAIDGPCPQTGQLRIFHGARRTGMRRIGKMVYRNARGRKKAIRD